MELLENLNWRYAVKRMTGRKVTQQKVDAILEAARLSASSGGLQPYKIIVVEDEALKKKLQAAAFNQPQVAGSLSPIDICCIRKDNATTCARLYRFASSRKKDSA